MKSVAKLESRAAFEDTERRTPYSQEAEACVLGAMLMDREAISLAVEKLDEDCFYIEAHRKLFKSMITLYEKSIEADPVTVAEQLKKDGTLEEIGGLPFIYEIASSVPTAANVAYHAQIVLDLKLQIFLNQIIHLNLYLNTY